MEKQPCRWVSNLARRRRRAKPQGVFTFKLSLLLGITLPPGEMHMKTMAATSKISESTLKTRSRFVFLAQLLQRNPHLNPSMVILYLPLRILVCCMKSCQWLFFFYVFLKLTTPQTAEQPCVYTCSGKAQVRSWVCRHRTNRMACFGSPVLTCKLPTHTPFQNAAPLMPIVGWATVRGSLSRWTGVNIYTRLGF